MNSCAKCGACSTVCPVYLATGRESLTARGKIHLLERLQAADSSGAYADILSKCLLCGACYHSCPRQVNTPALVVKARRELSRPGGKHAFGRSLIRKTLARAGALSGLLNAATTLGGPLLHLLPADSGLRLRLAMFESAQLQTPSSPKPPPAAVSREESGRPPAAAYFSGCLARHLAPQVSSATEWLLQTFSGASPLTPEAQGCCGQAALACGDLQTAQHLARKNIAAFENHSLPILTSCASCYSHLATYPDLFADDPAWQRRALDFAGRVREFSTFFHDMPEFMSRAAKLSLQADSPRRVLYHDPCHLRFKVQITEPPRTLLKALPGVEIIELPHGPGCCGQGGLFHIAHPDIAKAIRQRLMTDFNTLAVDTVTTTCSGCLLQWRQALTVGGGKAGIQHLALLLRDFLRGTPPLKKTTRQDHLDSCGK